MGSKLKRQNCTQGYLPPESFHSLLSRWFSVRIEKSSKTSKINQKQKKSIISGQLHCGLRGYEMLRPKNVNLAMGIHMNHKKSSQGFSNF